MISNNQYLTFNPKRPNRNDKPRQPYQLRFKPHQQPDTNAPQNHPSQLTSPQRQHFYDKRHDLPSYKPSEKEELRQSGYSTEQLYSEQSDRRKEDIIKRVKKLQNIVLPLVERDGGEDEQKGDIGWQSKVDRKLLRIQSSLDSVRKQWQIQMQKKLIRLQQQLQQRYLRLKQKIDDTMI